MDEKRFMELFPELEEDNKDKKQPEEFFSHIKAQIKPKKQWELPQVSDVLQKKKKRRKRILVYSATAAACLILVIILPNLSDILKIDSSIVSERDCDKKNETLDEIEESILPEAIESTRDDNKLEQEVSDNNDNKEIDTNVDHIRDISDSSHKEKNKKHNSDLLDYEGNNYNSNKKESKEQTGEEVKQQESEERPKPNKKKDNNVTKQEALKDKEGEKGKENIGHYDQPKDTENEVDSDKIVDSEGNLPMEEESDQEINSGSSNDMGQDDSHNSDYEEENHEETVSIITSTIENEQLPTGNIEEITDSDFYNALNGWREEEQDVVSHNKIDATKEAVEKELITYVYLYYQEEEKESWYQAENKVQSDVDGMELLGTALIFKKKSLLLDYENVQQNVYIYGEKQDLSTVFVRFQADGEDWYYEYKQQEE